MKRAVVRHGHVFRFSERLVNSGPNGIQLIIAGGESGVVKLKKMPA